MDLVTNVLLGRKGFCENKLSSFFDPLVSDEEKRFSYIDFRCQAYKYFFFLNGGVNSDRLELTHELTHLLSR